MAGGVSNSQVIRFATFEVDLHAGELRKAGLKLKLSGQPFQVLAILLEQPGIVVTREELQKRLWPDTFVDVDHNLNAAINKIRETLGDSAANPRFVETLARRGYRFIAPVEAVPTATAPTPVSGGSSTIRPPQDVFRHVWIFVGLVVLLAGVGGVLLFRWIYERPRPGSKWVQLTSFADSATSPALSSDGRMLAFIRGPGTFVSTGQIYVKLLPDGQPFELTHDTLPKMAPVFSPDGTRVTYTTTDSHFGWNTWTVPVLGGEPREILPNAAALTWTDRQHVLFSEIKSGVRMAIVTATESRSDERDIYVPATPVGMAHRSWLSPDGKWVLISEMDGVGWRPCRLVAFDGGSAGETVGPQAARCTYAAWSPTGQWMYFSANAGDGFHLWRQHFRAGAPEQLTFGPTEEEGIAVAADGRSLVASVGIDQEILWLHDANGDRRMSFEGNATVPGMGFAATGMRSVFSQDGTKLFYLLRKDASRAYFAGELWIADLKTGKSSPVFPGIVMSAFDVSSDGKRIAFSSLDEHGSSRVWIAALDHSTPPKEVGSADSYQPAFVQSNILLFRQRQAGAEIVFALEPNDTTPRRVASKPVVNFSAASPDGKWWLSGVGATARPMLGGPEIRICDFCEVGWGSGGKYFYVRLRDVGGEGFAGRGKVYVVALPAGRCLPDLPSSGIRSAEDFKQMHVVSVIDTSGISTFAPGPDPSTYAYSRIAVQRNLFRIPLN